jgi:hypothetical protein
MNENDGAQRGAGEMVAVLLGKAAAVLANEVYVIEEECIALGMADAAATFREHRETLQSIASVGLQLDDGFANQN